MQRILDIYIRCFEYDVEVYSQGWIYWLLLIPAIFYTIFFFMKWAVLTAPVWLPINMIIRGLLSRKSQSPRQTPAGDPVTLERLDGLVRSFPFPPEVAAAALARWGLTVREVIASSRSATTRPTNPSFPLPPEGPSLEELTVMINQIVPFPPPTSPAARAGVEAALRLLRTELAAAAAATGGVHERTRSVDLNSPPSEV